MSHGDKVVELPQGFRVVATSDGSPFAAIADEERRIYGVQFHPEVVHTPHGGALLRTSPSASQAARRLDHGAFRESAIARMREQVGAGRVICGLSGGVDWRSRRFGARGGGRAAGLHPGRHRAAARRRGRRGARAVPQPHNIPLDIIDAGDLFLDRLAGVSDPERSEKSSARPSSMSSSRKPSAWAGPIFWLRARSTPTSSIRSRSRARASPSSRTTTSAACPSGWTSAWSSRCASCSRTRSASSGASSACPTRSSAAIPSPAPGLPCAFSARSRGAPRHPAPGRPHLPGGDPHRRPLRCHLAGVRGAAAGPDRRGHGRHRTYENVCALRAVTSVDGMTADFSVRHGVFGRVANRIVNEVRGINRVVYDVTTKPPGTIEWE